MIKISRVERTCYSPYFLCQDPCFVMTWYLTPQSCSPCFTLSPARTHVLSCPALLLHSPIRPVSLIPLPGPMFCHVLVCNPTVLFALFHCPLPGPMFCYVLVCNPTVLFALFHCPLPGPMFCYVLVCNPTVLLVSLIPVPGPMFCYVLVCNPTVLFALFH